jgi:transcriptional regulator with XRE-family HTH domain
LTKVNHVYILNIYAYVILILGIYGGEYSNITTKRVREMIRTPDIIPNNLRNIREMKGKTMDETATALGINRSYMSILENAKANMSGETALKIIEYFDSSFAALFGQQGVMKLPYTTETLKTQPTKILLTKEEYQQFQAGDIIKAVKLVEQEFKKLDLPIDLADIEEISSEPVDGSNKVIVSIKATISEPTEEIGEFDMNLSSNMDLDLYRALKDKEFKNNEYFNVYFIENFLGIDKEQVQEAIGLTEKGYYEIFEAEKKISVKLMWRLVKFFKVPLEMIMNVDLYKKKFI